tara:strand:- start:1762 stop:3453 length:1692 start_codon:yes stop_codon:yes gene_type:complete
MKNLILSLRNFFLRNKIIKNYIFGLFNQKKKVIFLNENINNYIKTNSLIWLKKKTNNNNKVLIESLINHPHYLIPNCIIGKKLSLINKCDCVGMIKKGDIIAKEIMNSFGINEIIEINEGNYISKISYFLKSFYILSQLKSVDQIINFKINNIEIGKNVYESCVRYKKDLSSRINFPFYYFMSKALYYNDLFIKLLKQKNYKYLIQSEKQFVPFRILFQNALKSKIVIYSRYGLPNIALKRYNKFENVNLNRASVDINLVNYYYNQYKNFKINIPKKKIINKIKKNLGIENVQTLGLIKSKKSNFNFESKRYIREFFNWRDKKPIALVLCHNLVDGNFVNRWNLFKDNIDWLENTLRKIKLNKKVNWIIKPHPSEAFYNSKVGTNSIVDKFIDTKNNNIKIFPSNYNLKNIYNIVDLVVTSHGSCGHEYSALGIPVIICGDTYYKGFGFNIEPSSKKEYYNLLKNISKIRKLNKTQIEKSIIFNYVFRVITKVEIPTIYRSDITMNYNKEDFWRNSYNLLEKNKNINNNFFKSLEHQFKNNNENLINLSKANFKNRNNNYNFR